MTVEGNVSTDAFRVTTSVQNGIERITYSSTSSSHETPILMVHGMWHGAWCWADWQALLAQQGWASHAISLPGHGASPTRGNVRFATMGRYLKIMTQEIDRLPRKPILMGHTACRADAVHVALHPKSAGRGLNADLRRRGHRCRGITQQTLRRVGPGAEPTQPTVLVPFAKNQDADVVAGCGKGCCHQLERREVIG